MAQPYKPEEAVILFVTFQGAIYKAHLLTGTYYALYDPSELEFVQGKLSQLHIPWDNFEATGNLNGFGVEVKR